MSIYTLLQAHRTIGRTTRYWAASCLIFLKTYNDSYKRRKTKQARPKQNLIPGLPLLCYSNLTSWLGENAPHTSGFFDKVICQRL